MSSTSRELTVKVNAQISSANMNPSQAAYPGSPLLSGGGSPGHAGGANAAGGDSAVVQAEKEHKKRMEEHSTRLKGLSDDILKTSLGLSVLTGSTSGFSKGLEKAANALALLSVAGSGVSAAKTLFSPSTWKSAGSLLANPATALTAGAATGLASVGYGLYSGQEDGTSYFGGLNQLRANTLGGGKVNSRGQWVSQDQQLGNIHHQFNERMRRDEMQHPVSAIKMEGRESQYALIDQMHDIRMQGMSYKGYASDAVTAEKEHRKLFNDNITSSRNVYESVYGKEIGGLMAQREGHGADLLSQTYGSQAADLAKDQRLNKTKGSALQWQLSRAHTNFNEAADSRDADMKGKNYNTKSMLDEQKNILRINDEIKKNKVEQLELDKKASELTTKALQAKKADTDSRLVSASNLLSSLTQSLEGNKQSFGMMDEGDQMYHKDIAQRFKAGGISAISSEERGILMNSPLGEDVRRQAIEIAENSPAFTDMFKGSRMEANMNKAKDQIQGLDRITIEIKNQINAKMESDQQEIAKKFLEVAMPYFVKGSVEIQRAVSIATGQAENAAIRSAHEKMGNQP